MTRMGLGLWLGSGTPTGLIDYAVIADTSVAVTLENGVVLTIERDTDAPTYADLYRVLDATGAEGRAIDRANDSSWEHAFATGGNWMGCSHGNEELSAVALSVDGQAVSLSAPSSGTGRVVALPQTTSLLDPVSHAAVASLALTHEAQLNHLDIQHVLTWGAAVSLTNAYSSMLPLNTWAVNRSQRAPAYTTEVLWGADQSPIEGSIIRTYSAGGGLSVTMSLLSASGLPLSPESFVQVDANPNKSYLDVSGAYTTSIGEVWSWTTRYDFAMTDLSAVCAGLQWECLWDADEQASTVETVAWYPLVSSEPLVPGVVGPTYSATGVGGDRAGVSFVDASEQYVLGPESVAAAVDGDDTPFAVAVHFVLDSSASSDTIWAFGSTVGGYPYIRLRVASDGESLQMEARDAAGSAVVTSDAIAVTDAEHTVLVVRHAATVDVYLDGVKTTSDFAVGDLSTLNRFAIGALIRSSLGNYAGITVRRAGVIVGAAADALVQDDATAIHTAWYGS